MATNHYLRLGSAAMLMFGLLHAEQARAQDASKLPPVQFTVTVAHAMAEPGAVAAEFRGFQRQMPHLSSIRVLDKQSFRLQFGEWARMSLPTGSDVSVLPLAVHGGRLHMQFNLPGKLNTSMRLSNHKPMTVGAGRYQRGHLLIQVDPDFSAYLPVEADPAGPPTYRVNKQR
jgi:hypothetical protein